MNRLRIIQVGAFVAVLLCAVPGCGTGAHKPIRAELQFAAGQEDAFAMLQQSGIFVIRFVGPFERPVVMWHEEMTLAEAILQAGYMSQQDPAQIIIRRNATAVTIDPRQLLEGEHVAVESGDVIQVLP